MIYSYFNKHYQEIEVKSWIEVVPQIIARISTPSPKISEIL